MTQTRTIDQDITHYARTAQHAEDALYHLTGDDDQLLHIADMARTAGRSQAIADVLVELLDCLNDGDDLAGAIEHITTNFTA